MFCIFAVGLTRTTSTLCPLPWPRANADVDEGEDGALTGIDYEPKLHYHDAIAHMRRADGAQPDFEDETKALDIFC